MFFNSKGLIKNVKSGIMNIELTQTLKTYNAQLTYSGLYLFNPINQGTEVENLNVKKTVLIKGKL